MSRISKMVIRHINRNKRKFWIDFHLQKAFLESCLVSVLLAIATDESDRNDGLYDVSSMISGPNSTSMIWYLVRNADK
jgi:hypothetical protein